MSPGTKTVVVICGPTAVGKTSFAIKLAQQFNTQIISADSRQCYKELNIGVAKPSPAELATIHHYFISSHSIHHNVNAGVFEQYTLQSCESIFTNSNVAVMAGGTGLYIKAFCEGIDAIPPTPPEVRHQLNTNYQQHGMEWLQNQVQNKDPAFWQVAEQQNPHRLLRALEVLETSGRSITEFRSGATIERPFNIIKVGMELPRPVLNERINTRVDQMMADGLLSEVRNLLPHQQLSALQTVGYSELFDHLNGLMSVEAAVERIKINTRQYAKRQMTWFKKDRSIHWLQPGDVTIDNITAILNKV